MFPLGHIFPSRARRHSLIIPIHSGGTHARTQNQRIRVGDQVVVTVVRVSGDKVRIGIQAPHDMRVLRDELEDDSIGEVVLEPSDTLPIPRLLRFVG